jgi:hypothetical protein
LIKRHVCALFDFADFASEKSSLFGLMTWRCCVLQHQQQVATAVERAKQVTMTELNAIIGVSTRFGSGLKK